MGVSRLRALWDRDRVLFRFLLTGVGGYAVWHVLYTAVIQVYTQFDAWVIARLAYGTQTWGRLVGMEFWVEEGRWPSVVGGVGHAGVTIGEPCDGVVLFALFAVFVAAFPGRWRHKLWFIPLGIGVVHGCNLARVFGLTCIQAAAPELLQFNHDYTFTVAVYAVVLALWYLYVRLPLFR